MIGNFVRGGFAIYDDATSEFKRRKTLREKEEAQKAEAEKKKEMDRVRERGLQKARDQIQARRDSRDVNMQDARDGQTIRNENEDQDLTRRITEGKAVTDNVNSVLGTTGQEGRATLTTAGEVAASTNRSNIDSWRTGAFPAMKELVAMQQGHEMDQMGMVFGTTPLMENVMANQREDRAHQMALMKQAGQITGKDIAQAVLGAGLLFM